MAKITLNQPIAEIHGALSKRSNIVNRQKKYRINGRVIHEGKQESYAIVNPRDWKKTPAKGAELANQTAWQEACRRAAQLRPLFFESVCSFSQITFGYLSYYPATCFAFASGLANIPAFTLYTKKSPSKAIFLAQSKIFHYLCNRFGKALPITTYFSIAL